MVKKMYEVQLLVWALRPSDKKDVQNAAFSAGYAGMWRDAKASDEVRKRPDVVRRQMAAVDRWARHVP